MIRFWLLPPAAAGAVVGFAPAAGAVVAAAAAGVAAPPPAAGAVVPGLAGGAGAPHAVAANSSTPTNVAHTESRCISVPLRVWENLPKTARVSVHHRRQALLRQYNVPLETAPRRSTFLAEVSKRLADSLEYETTLHGVARAAIPQLADWCAVDLLRAGETGS